MHYKIIAVTRLGCKQYIGILSTDSGKRLGVVEAWSMAGCLTALRRLAVKLTAQTKAA